MLGAAVQKRLMGGAVDLAALQGRLRAWWEGEEWQPAPVMETQVAEPAAEAVAPAPEKRDASFPYWTPERIEVAQRLWGREHISPGGDVYARYILKPLGLNPSLAVAEIGSALGGTTRLMHRSANIWVKGYEPCPQLAEAGMALSAAAGLSTKAPIAGMDLTAPELKRGSLDRIVLRDLLHTVPDKVALLKALATALKPKGQLLLTDFVLQDGGTPAEVLLWAENEPIQSHPWSARVMTETLEDLQFTVQVAEDETAMLRQMIFDGWKAFRSSIRSEPLPPEQQQAVFDEGERWARCLAAFGTGGLHYMRVVASR